MNTNSWCDQRLPSTTACLRRNSDVGETKSKKSLVTTINRSFAGYFSEFSFILIEYTSRYRVPLSPRNDSKRLSTRVLPIQWLRVIYVGYRRTQVRPLSSSVHSNRPLHFGSAPVNTGFPVPISRTSPTTAKHRTAAVAFE